MNGIRKTIICNGAAVTHLRLSHAKQGLSLSFLQTFLLPLIFLSICPVYMQFFLLTIQSKYSSVPSY